MAEACRDRSRQLARGALASLALSLLTTSCAESGASTQTRAPAATNNPVSTRALLPLEHDTVLSYETSSDAGQSGLTVLQVRRPRPDLAELDIAGRVQRLDIDDASVMHAGGGYLLKDPIAVGATFPGAFGEVRVIRIDQAVTVPAGSFEGCTVTVEESAQPFKRAQSTYCPDIGLVSLVVEASGEAEALRVESRLKSYGPRVDLQ